MDPLADVIFPQTSTNRKHSHHCRLIRLKTAMTHLMKNFQSFTLSPTFGQARQHRIPRNYTPLSHLLKEVITHVHISIFTIPTNH
ncbi:hypothetical protein HanIR_Chr03g0110671 [Helianthus annuus]|nr:hypothetical protein HanIR_Chr03g0110671 [Helianthus annuus]